MSRQLWAVVAIAVVGGGARADLNLITNGDFQTGDLSGWTNFYTANGDLGYYNRPQVESFNTTGAGASLAARFQVGQTFFTNFSDYQGGGIYQSVTATGGLYSFHADVASFNPFTASSNGSAGRFELLIDGVGYADVDLGSIVAQDTKRGVLSATVQLTGGTHDVRIRVTRVGGNSFTTPVQYLDNVSLTQIALPEPSAVGMGLVGLSVMSGGLGWVRRRLSGPTAA